MSKDIKMHWVMDYETICDTFIGVFQHYTDDSISEVFIINKDQNDLPNFVTFLNKCVTEKQWHISYNGLAFDAQITQSILDNKHKLLKLSGKAVAEEIYQYAQETINRSNNREFAKYSPKQLKIRQIDLFKLNHWDNAAKMSSLKWIQYSMDWYNVEEMPHRHDQPVETSKQLSEIVEYCINDVRSTKQILIHSKEQIQLRQTLTKEYGIDLYSASEPRISKELFMHFLEKKLGTPKSELKELRTPRQVIFLGQVILPYVKFETLEFQEMLQFFLTKVITSTKDGFKYSLNYKGVKTDYGLGGIHGAPDQGVYEAPDGWTIMTSDVVSFYPNLAIKNKFHPKHIPQAEFTELYEWFFEERKKIPKTDPKNYVYKLILNSTYGLTGDANSFLYDPLMTMQITINGQLSLSMLHEMLCLAIPEGRPLMQNTDGLEMMIPNDKIETYMKISEKWEIITKLKLEHDQYSKMIIGDVNNYMAVYKNGKTKCKGRFVWEDFEKKKVSIFHKNKSFLIIPKAIYAYFTQNILPEDFLAQNKSVHDYCAGVKAKSGWFYEEINVVNGTPVIKKLQKIVRYFISNEGSKIIKRHSDGREIQTEAGQWYQTTVNHIPEGTELTSFDINVDYYLEKIYKEINQIEKVTDRTCTQLSLF